MGVPFGGGSAILLLTIFTVCGAALIAGTAAIGDNYAALLGIAVWPIVTFWWMHLGLQLPGTYDPGTWERGGPKHTMGTDGGLLVFWSVTSLLAAVWFLGESRVPWWVRLPVSVAVIAANVTVAAMVTGASASG